MEGVHGWYFSTQKVRIPLIKGLAIIFPQITPSGTSFTGILYFPVFLFTPCYPPIGPYITISTGIPGVGGMALAYCYSLQMDGCGWDWIGSEDLQGLIPAFGTWQNGHTSPEMALVHSTPLCIYHQVTGPNRALLGPIGSYRAPIGPYRAAIGPL